MIVTLKVVKPNSLPVFIIRLYSLRFFLQIWIIPVIWILKFQVACLEHYLMALKYNVLKLLNVIWTQADMCQQVIATHAGDQKNYFTALFSLMEG